METRMQYAVAWKEFRQIVWILVCFFAITLFIFVPVIRLNPEYDPSNSVFRSRMIQAIIVFAYITSVCLAYFLSVGNRMIEHSQRLDSFLFVRPVSHWTLFKTYYCVGLIGWIVWAFVFVITLMLVTGISPFTHYSQAPLLYEFAKIALYFFFIYTFTFSAGMIFPTLPFTVGVCVSSFIIPVFYVNDPHFFYKLFHLLYNLSPLTIPLLLLMVTYYVYTHKQVEQ